MFIIKKCRDNSYNYSHGGEWATALEKQNPSEESLGDGLFIETILTYSLCKL